MKMFGIPGFTDLAFAPHASAAAARGVRAEDRIAAVYDHGSVVQALGRKHNVAFFSIYGALSPESGTRRAIEAIAESAFGVVKGSARVSVETASLSLAFDPQRAAFAAIQRILDRKLAAKRLSLLPMRILDEPSGMTPA